MKRPGSTEGGPRLHPALHAGREPCHFRSESDPLRGVAFQKAPALERTWRLHPILNETRLSLGGGHVQVQLCLLGHCLAVLSSGSSEAVKGRSCPLRSAPLDSSQVAGTADTADRSTHGQTPRGGMRDAGGGGWPSCCLATGSSPHLFFQGLQWGPGFVIGSAFCFLLSIFNH